MPLYPYRGCPSYMLTTCHCFFALKDTNKFLTPNRGFVIHEDTGRKGLKEKSTESRRVLSDISNKQRGRHGNSNVDGIASTKKGLGGQPKKRSPNKRTPLTPLRSKSRAHLTPKPRASLAPKVRAASQSAINTPRVEEVLDIEFAYGGVSSPKAESACVKGLDDAIWQDLLTRETPTLFDDFNPTRVVDVWDDSRERVMLESGETPSLWWASPNQQTKREAKDPDAKELEEREQVEGDDLKDLPPPDNVPKDAINDLDDDGLLENILNVDVEAVCSD